MMRSLVETLAGAVLLVGVGHLNGHLSIATDTIAYLRQGEFFATYLHLGSPLGNAANVLSSTAVTPAALAKFGPLAATTIGARSPLYGLLLFLLTDFGTIWTVALAQAMVSAWLVRLTCKTAIPDHASTVYWIAIASLSLVSGLPLFVDFIMPDLFAGIAILATSLLLVAKDKLTKSEAGGLFVLLLASVLFHRSHLVVMLLILCVGVPLLLFEGYSRRVVAERGALILLALVGFVGVDFTCGAAFEADTGFAQGRPPFLMARMLIDGAGRDYLQARCPGGASPTLCQFKDGYLRTEEDILWTQIPYLGVFGSADYATRLKLENEEMPFVIASIMFDPKQALTSALRNWWTQLQDIMFVDVMRDPARFKAYLWADAPALERLLPDTPPCFDRKGCQSVPVGTAILISYLIEIPALIASLCIIVIFAVWRKVVVPKNPDLRQHISMAASGGILILAGVIANAAVCGILSGPFDRYEARVIWLVPLLAVIAFSLIVRYLRVSKAPTSFFIRHPWRVVGA